ncbi:MAG: hypothetical protein QOI90_2349 [Mycobacterium sp.]|jgi:hypothetical protein|nr:hypothetical protein [Mycobacterium sp.]
MVSFCWMTPIPPAPPALVVCTSTAVGLMVSVMVAVAMFPVVVPSEAR